MMPLLIQCTAGEPRCTDGGAVSVQVDLNPSPVAVSRMIRHRIRRLVDFKISMK